MRFRIDARDTVVYAEGRLDRYARAAGVPQLPADWLGEVVWHCVADEEARALLAALVARARSGRTVKLRSRRRLPCTAVPVDIEIAPLAKGVVEFRCSFGSDAPTTPEPAGLKRLRVCAWCYRADHGGWREIEDVVASERLFEGPSIPVVTHGICDACLAKVTAHLDAIGH